MAKMKEAERYMLEDMFFKLLHEEVNNFERLTILEEFTYMTIDLIERHEKNEKLKKEEVEPFIDLLEHFESISLKHDNEFLCGFFYTLADMLTLKFKYAKLTNEVIDRKDHEEEFTKMKEKYGWNNIHVMNKTDVLLRKCLSHVKEKEEDYDIRLDLPKANN